MTNHYRFYPPVRREPASDSRDPLHRFMSMRVGFSVVERDGRYTVVPYPWLGELDPLRDGSTYFLGGHGPYEVDVTTADRLVEHINAVWVENESEVTDPSNGYLVSIPVEAGFGLGGFGEGIFGT